MYHRVLLAGAILVSGCGQTLAKPVSTRTSAAPEDAYDCVKKQLGAIGYKQTSYDETERRVSGTKIDAVSRRPDTQFRRILNKISAEVAPAADGGTGIQVVPSTFAEYTTQRGPTEVEEKASAEVKADAERLLELCRS